MYKKVYESLLCRCCSQREETPQSPAEHYSLCNQDWPHFTERVLWIHLLYNVKDILLAVAAGKQCDSWALDEGDLLMTPGDSKNMAWTNTRGFWKTKLWSNLLKNRCLCFSLIFFHSHLVAFYPTSVFLSKILFHCITKNILCPLQGPAVSSSAGLLSFPTLIFSLMRHCYSTAVPVTSSSINAQVSVEIPFWLLFCTSGISVVTFLVKYPLSKWNIQWVVLKSCSVLSEKDERESSNVLCSLYILLQFRNV